MLENFFQGTVEQPSVLLVVMNLSIGLFLGILLKKHFERFGSTFSGKQELSRLFPILIVIVCLIITIVKSSLALSLGLVGALSIVRFRTPIKEPEELVYLFMAIAVGLGLGANQTFLTVVSFVFILVTTAVLRFRDYKSGASLFYVLITLPNSEDTKDIQSEISTILSGKSRYINLKRLESGDGQVVASFEIDVQEYKTAFGITEEIKDKFPDASVTMIDQSRIPGV